VLVERAVTLPPPLLEVLSVLGVVVLEVAVVVAAALVLLSAAAVSGAADPEVPPQAASATGRLPSNVNQASRPPPKLCLAFFMRPLE
jgi:hypothetical protein